MRDATYARMRVPYRSTIDTTQPNRKPIHGEEVYTLNMIYRQVLGRWIKTPTSPQKEIDGEKGIDATFSNCRHDGDSVLNGEPVTIYSATTRNVTLIPFTGDLKLWISKRHGIPVRSEANASIPVLGRSHTVKVFSYDNVSPPRDN